MVFRAYEVFLNLGASVEMGECDAVSAIWACIGSMTQSIPRTFVLTEAEGRAAQPANVTSRNRLNTLCRDRVMRVVVIVGLQCRVTCSMLRGER